LGDAASFPRRATKAGLAPSAAGRRTVFADSRRDDEALGTNAEAEEPNEREMRAI
jgi:hypothetical protein